MSSRPLSSPSRPKPTAGVPVPTVAGSTTGNDDFVALAHTDLVVTTRAAVLLHCLIRLHVPHLEFVSLVEHKESTVLPCRRAPRPSAATSSSRPTVPASPRSSQSAGSPATSVARGCCPGSLFAPRQGARVPRRHHRCPRVRAHRPRESRRAARPAARRSHPPRGAAHVEAEDVAQAFMFSSRDTAEAVPTFMEKRGDVAGTIDGTITRPRR
jgi:hypothetical protein